MLGADYARLSKMLKCDGIIKEYEQCLMAVLNPDINRGELRAKSKGGQDVGYTSKIL